MRRATNGLWRGAGGERASNGRVSRTRDLWAGAPLSPPCQASSPGWRAFLFLQQWALHPRHACCHSCGQEFALVNYNGPEPTCFPCRQKAARTATQKMRAVKETRRCKDLKKSVREALRAARPIVSPAAVLAVAARAGAAGPPAAPTAATLAAARAACLEPGVIPGAARAEARAARLDAVAARQAAAVAPPPATSPHGGSGAAVRAAAAAVQKAAAEMAAAARDDRRQVAAAAPRVAQQRAAAAAAPATAAPAAAAPAEAAPEAAMLRAATPRLVSPPPPPPLLVQRDCCSCGEPAYVTPDIAWDAAQCSACAPVMGPAQLDVGAPCTCQGGGKRDFCICGRRAGGHAGRVECGRGSAAVAAVSAKRSYRCSRCGQQKKGHVCPAAGKRAASPINVAHSDGESSEDDRLTAAAARRRRMQGQR